LTQTYETTRRHIPEDNIHRYGRDKHKPNNITFYNFQIENKVYAYFTLLKNST